MIQASANIAYIDTRLLNLRKVMRCETYYIHLQQQKINNHTNKKIIHENKNCRYVSRNIICLS